MLRQPMRKYLDQVTILDFRFTIDIMVATIVVNSKWVRREINFGCGKFDDLLSISIWTTLNRLLMLGAISVLLASLLYLKPTPLAHACTQPPGGHPSYSVTEQTNAATIVLEGTVTAISDTYQGTASVRVARYFKGYGPATVTIDRLGTSALCLSSVVVEGRYIFYAYGNTPAVLTANYLSAGDAVDGVDTHTVAEIIAAVGHDPLSPVKKIYLPIILKTR